MKTLNVVAPWYNQELWSILIEAISMGLDYEQTRSIIKERFEGYDISLDQFNAMNYLFDASFHLDSSKCVVGREGEVIPLKKFYVDMKYDKEGMYQTIRLPVEVPNRQDAYIAALDQLPYSWKCHIDEIVVTNVEEVVDAGTPF